MPRKQQAPAVIQVVGGFVPPPIPIMDPLSAGLSVLNANPYIIGIFYIFLNMGGRFLSMELTKRQEWFLSQPYVRPFILFSVMFIATRNLAVAFWTTTLVLSVLWLFANENSALCLIPEWRNDREKKQSEDKSYEDKMKAVQKHSTEFHAHTNEPHDEHHEEHHDEHHDEHFDDQNTENTPA
jgi:hypothetical protein